MQLIGKRDASMLTLLCVISFFVNEVESCREGGREVEGR